MDLKIAKKMRSDTCLVYRTKAEPASIRRFNKAISISRLMLDLG